MSDVVVESYNATLTIEKQLKHLDSILVLDNEVLYDVTNGNLGKNLQLITYWF